MLTSAKIPSATSARGIPKSESATSDCTLFCSSTGIAVWSVAITTGIDLEAGWAPGETGVVRPTLTTLALLFTFVILDILDYPSLCHHKAIDYI